MPELPEVETCRRGLAPHVLQQTIQQVTVREERLRWRIPHFLAERLQQRQFINLMRRGKYLLFAVSQHETLLLHLGMSGRVCIVAAHTPPGKHDHVDIVFNNGQCLRFNDSRRFGAVLWIEGEALQHPLLIDLGPEPLSEDFHAHYLQSKLVRRQQAIKQALMDSHLVVGIGNIYANEALYLAKIHPHRPAQSLTKVELQRLIKSIHKVLNNAIAAGGTTLRDFIAADGKPGYFQQQLHVYGRAGLSCPSCQHILQASRLGQRSTVYCEYCQL